MFLCIHGGLHTTEEERIKNLNPFGDMVNNCGNNNCGNNFGDNVNNCGNNCGNNVNNCGNNVNNVNNVNTNDNQNNINRVAQQYPKQYPPNPGHVPGTDYLNAPPPPAPAPAPPGGIPAPPVSPTKVNLEDPSRLLATEDEI